MVNITEDNYQSYIDDKKDYIDLNLIFISVLRNIKIISIFTFLGILISGIYAFNQKKVYKGEFQIVIDTNSSSSNALDRIDPRFLQFAGIGGSSKKLDTQVGILNSPSVLMNVFDFVKSKKALKSDVTNMRFKNWKNSNLKITLKERTSILGITYKDTDKDLVLPVLRRISKEYQRYSGKKRLRQLNLGINFFEEQIKKFKDKSRASFYAAQKFGMKYNLSSSSNNSFSPFQFDTDNSLMRGSIPQVSTNNSNETTNVEQSRIRIKNDMIFLKKRLNSLEKIDENSNEILFFASTFPSVRNSELFEKLNLIDLRISELKVILKDNDIDIKNALIERKTLVNLLKKQVTGLLKTQIDSLSKNLEAIDQPEEVLIKYKELVRESKKDISTLDNLENNYRKVLLEQSRLKDPWELITQPTIYPFHVAPKKKRILAFGLFAGLFTGFSIGLIKDKKENLILTLDDHNLCKGWKNLCSLPISCRENWQEEIELLSNGPLSKIKGGISLLFIGNIPLESLNEIESNFKSYLNKLEIIKTNNILESTRCENILIITELGITKKRDFLLTYEKLNLQNKNILGSIIISKNYWNNLLFNNLKLFKF